MMTVAAFFAFWNAWWTDSVAPWHQPTFPRLLLALALGILIGAERQWRQRAAGLRTNTLVCLGAAAFVDLGLTVAPNTTQVIAYVVSGVGFLGAGAIMKEGANVRGLNTAATLWCSAAVGACAGAGELLDSIFVAVLLLGINSALRPLSHFIDRRSLASLNSEVFYRIRILSEAGHQDQVRKHLEEVIARQSFTMSELREERDADTATDMLQAILVSDGSNEKGLRDLTTRLRSCPWVQSVDASGTDPEAE
jgi:putative Mg2+ transporter-C (MgtC) family protein